MKILLFTLIFCASSFTYAQKDCKSSAQIQVPGYVLEEFFNPAKGQKKHFFALPENYCAEVGKRIQMIDPYGNEAGSFIIRQEWTGLYTTDTLVNLKEKDLPLVVRDFLISRKLDGNTLNALIRLTFDPDFSLDKNPIRLLLGDFSLNDGYSLNWNATTEPLKLKYVKRIGYDEAISLLGSALVIDALPQSPLREKNNWRIPGAIQSPVVSSFPCGMMSWINLLANGRSADFNKYKDRIDKPVVVYSSHIEPSCSINTISALQLAGFKDIRWFELAPREWQYGADDARKHMMKPELKQLDGAEVLKMKSLANVSVIDVRPEERYKEGHIDKALNNPFNLVDVQEFIKGTKSSPNAKSLINQSKGTAGYMKYSISKQIPKGVDTLIFYTDSFRPTDFVGISKQIHRYFEKPETIKVYFYQGGMADWLGRSQWQPDLYKIGVKTNQSADK